MLTQGMLDCLKSAQLHIKIVASRTETEREKKHLTEAQEDIQACISEDMADEYLEAEGEQYATDRLFEAKKLVEKAIEIMTPEQVGQWEGVSEWQEMV